MKLDFELEGVVVKYDGTSDKGLNLLKDLLTTISKNNNHNTQEEAPITVVDSNKVSDTVIKHAPRTRLYNQGLQKELITFLSTGPVNLSDLQRVMPSIAGKLFSILNRLVMQKYIVITKCKIGEDPKYLLAPKGKRYLELIKEHYRLDRNASKALKQEFS